MPNPVLSVQDSSSGRSVAVEGTDGATHVTTRGAPKSSATPTIKTNAGGTTSYGNDVVISSAAAAGSKHLDDLTPTESETLQELIAWEFTTTQNVKTAVLSLLSEPGSVSECSYLVFTINGDIVADATRLFNGYPDVSRVMTNESVEINTVVPITRIAAIGRNSGVAKSAGLICIASCEGYTHE